MAAFRKQTTNHMYDLIVLGAGSGGVRAARIAGSHGAKVALIEGSMEHGPPSYTAIGGTCVNVGCVPKKLFVYGSHYSAGFREAAGFGWENVTTSGHSWETLNRNKNKEISRLNGIYSKMLVNAGVDLIQGWGSLKDAHTMEVAGDSGKVKTLTGETILVCTGGWPFKPEIPGIDLAIDSNSIFYLPERPQRVLVVGGGYIATEFAGVLHGYGSEVDLMYRGDLFLKGFDTEIRKHLEKEYNTAGINLRFNENVAAIKKNHDGSLQVTTEKGQVGNYDAVLYATGRNCIPKTKNIGLEECGVQMDRNGVIAVDAMSKTTVDNIYAVGDVTDRINLTPVALHEGHCFADTLYGGVTRKPDHDLVASAVFSDPEIGTVGLTEEAALKKYRNLSVFTSEFRELKHVMTGRETRCLMKIIVSSDDDKVRGVHMCGNHAAEILQGIGIAVKMGATKADFDKTIGIHPSSAEEFVTMRSAKRTYVNGELLNPSKV